MSEQRINPYEGMFLFPQSATANLTAAADHIKEILARANAELISLSKWDERRLAYPIKSNKRGVYFLVYFKAPADKLSVIERACNLSEEMLRTMITRADHIPMEQMQAADGQQRLADESKLRAAEAAGEDADSERETTYVEPSESGIKP